MDLLDTVIIVNGKEIKVETVLVYLKTNGAFKNGICHLVETEVIRDKSKELGIKITDEEFEEYAMAKRRYWGLTRAEDMNNHCKSMGINMEQWRFVNKNEMLRNKVRSKVVKEEDIVNFFTGKQDLFQTAALSRIVLLEKSLAEEVMKKVKTNVLEFSVAARRYSVEENTKIAGGYLGTMKPGMLPEPINKTVFSSRAQEIIGPFHENNHWSIYKIETMNHAKLVESLKKEISNRLFFNWLQQAITESKFEKPV